MFSSRILHFIAAVALIVQHIESVAVFNLGSCGWFSRVNRLYQLIDAAAGIALQEGFFADILANSSFTVQVYLADTSCQASVASKKSIPLFLGKGLVAGRIYDSLAAEEPVVAISGCQCSGESSVVSNFATDFHVPIVSGSATATYLSKKADHPFFLRTIPTDANIALALLALVLHFKWTYVSVLVAEGTIGGGEIIHTTFIKEAPSSLQIEGLSIPLPTIQSINGTSTTITRFSDLRDLAYRILHLRPQPRIFVVACHAPGIFLDFMKAAEYVNLLRSDVVWMLPPTLGHLQALVAPPNSRVSLYIGFPDRNFSTMPSLMLGSFAISPLTQGRKFRSPRFANFWTNLTCGKLRAAGVHAQYPCNNAWFQNLQYLSQWSYYALRFDAMTAIIVAIGDLLAAKTNPIDVKGWVLLQAMQSAKFEGLTGDVAFNKDQDRIGATYAVKNLRMAASVPQFVEIGVTSGSNVSIGSPQFGDGTSVPPASRPQSCPPGYEYSGVNFTCQPCPRFFLYDLQSQTCFIFCPAGYQPGNVSNSCDLCALGRFKAASGNAPCKFCSAGTLAAAPGMSECLVCVQGTFGHTGSRCEKCPSGRTTLANGMANLTDCVCEQGTYAEDDTCENCWPSQTTEGSRGATSVDDCYFKPEFYVIVFISTLILIMVPLACGGYLFLQKKLRKMVEDQQCDKILQCIRNSNDLLFPMAVMNVKDFKSLDKLTSYEDVHKLLIVLNTLDEINKFKDDNKIIFCSHQWLAWTQPDPENVHYNAIVHAADTVMSKFDWTASSETVYLWVDYHSVPQLNRHLQRLAIDTLPFYASLSTVFVIVAPETQHCNTKATCNFQTYQQRMWCRAELFSFYLRRGVGGLYKMEETDMGIRMASVEESEIDDTILVFEGSCTCCAISHSGMDMCDKHILRDVFLGIYADVLWSARSTGARRSLVLKTDEIISRIYRQKDRIFPLTVEGYFQVQQRSSGTSRISKSKAIDASRKSSESSTNDKYDGSGSKSPTKKGHVKFVTEELFGNLIAILERMIEGEDKDIVELLSQRQIANDNVGNTPAPSEHAMSHGDILRKQVIDAQWDNDINEMESTELDTLSSAIASQCRLPANVCGCRQPVIVCL